MNPLTQIRQIKKINEAELKLGIAGEKKSWHDVYKDSAWIFVGGLNFELTEGDVISVFSQYGEVVNMNLVRDPKTGKSRGFAFICYEDQRSTVLSVDNLNGIKVAGRTIRVDHVANYKPPKEKDETDELTRLIYERGCGPDVNISALQKEAAKREKLKRGRDQQGREFDKPWPRGVSVNKVKVEYDDDGDVCRRSDVKAEYDDDGDVRVGSFRAVKTEPNAFDDDGDVRRGGPPVDYDDDGDIVATKRRNVNDSKSSFNSSSSRQAHNRHYRQAEESHKPHHRHRHHHHHH